MKIQSPEEQRIIQAMRVIHNSKRVKYELKAQTYLKAVCDAVIVSAADQRDGVFLRVSELDKQLGRYGSRGKQYSWLYALEQHAPIYTRLKTGTNVGGLCVETEIEVANVEEILQSADATVLLTRIKSKITEDVTLSHLRVDVGNLAGYIDATIKNPNCNDKMISNVAHARAILQLARVCPNNEIPVLKSVSKFGREYHKGLSLQSSPAVVRKAALGSDVTEVDISNCAFTWLYNEVDEYTRGNFKALPNYLEHKTELRASLAYDIFGHLPNYNEATSINTIKKVLTSLSFGARLNAGHGVYYDISGKQHTMAFADAVTSPKLRQKIIEHGFFKNFTAELSQARKVIIEQHRASLMCNEELTTTSGKLSPNKAMAWLYQHAEKAIMDKMAAELDLTIVLGVHDGVYVSGFVDVTALKNWMKRQWRHGKVDVAPIKDWHKNTPKTSTHTIAVNVQPALIEPIKKKPLLLTPLTAEQIAMKVKKVKENTITANAPVTAEAEPTVGARSDIAAMMNNNN